MATSYTSLLGLALPVTGELSSTWGDTVNDYITQYLDASIAGTQTISGSQTAVTLSKTTNASLSQAASGATGSSQYQIINCTGNPASLLTITVPAASKAYLVLNNTSTNQSVKVVGAGPTTGVTVAAARCALIAWNGSDFELVASTDITTLQGTLATTNGGTGLTSFTANGVVYASSTSALTTGSALTFNGTNLYTTGNIYGGTGNANANILAYSNVVNGGAGFSQFLFANISSETRGFLSYSHAVDAMLFGVVGSEQMRLTSTGLGIGTSSPGYKLDVSATGTTVSSAFRSDQSEMWMMLKDSGTTLGHVRLGSASGAMLFYSGNNTRATLDSSGNLGLGVTPSAWATYKSIDLPAGGYVSSGGDWMEVMMNTYFNGGYKYKFNGYASHYLQQSGAHFWYTAPSGTAGNTISFTQALTLDANRNLLLNGTTAGASSVGTFTLFNGTAPTGSVTDGVILFAADISASSELRVRDEAGNVTTLSPHNFSLIPEGPSEDMAWAYYSEKGGKRINVDMLKLARMVEKLTGEKLVYES